MRTNNRTEQTRLKLLDLCEEVGPGGRLPGERVLAARWAVARMTLRHAVEDLVVDGRLERRPGSGTYVAQPAFAKLLVLTSFTADMRARGLAVESEVFDTRGVRADAELAHRLRVPVGEPVTRFGRVRKVEGEPIAVETVWIADRHAPGIRDRDLTGSLYELLQARYGIAPASADTTIDTVLPDARTAERLGMGPHQPGLRLQMVDRDARGHVIMAADCFYRGDRYQLELTVGARPSGRLERTGSALRLAAAQHTVRRLGRVG